MARGGGSKPNSDTNKRSKASATSPSKDEPAPANVPQYLQQKCLDIFRNAFKPSPEESLIVQEIKGHLYHRDFAAAFGKEEYLRVYASRWSPSRALAYLQIFRSLEDYLNVEEGTDAVDPVIRTVCPGGGAGGELVGLAGWLSLLHLESPSRSACQFQVSLLDIADWRTVIASLENGITTAPLLSKYASQAKRNANIPLLQRSNVTVKLHQLDVLDTTNLPDTLLSESFEHANLVTFMFTLNELYSISLPKTQHLLSKITSATTPGSLLLVVDSPGSYSTVSISGAEKKYPMEWLLDYALLGPAQQTNKSTSVTLRWEKLISDKSRWYRLPKGLQYPIELEDMRYQIHLYRRLGKEDD